jgi:hypothetical protein
MAEEKSIFEKIGNAIADYAPALAGTLVATGVGAPAGAVVAGLGALAKVFGLGSAAKPEDILTAVTADPEIRLKAMIANNDFLLKQKEQELEEFKVTLADIQSARAREVSTKDSVNKVLAYTIVGAFIALVGATLLGYAKVESALAGTLVGYLSAKAEQVLAYYFGSSKGSHEKTLLLSKAEPIK